MDAKIKMILKFRRTDMFGSQTMRDLSWVKVIRARVRVRKWICMRCSLLLFSEKKAIVVLSKCELDKVDCFMPIITYI